MPTSHVSRRPFPRRRGALGVALVSILVAGLAHCSSDAPSPEPEARPVRFEVVSSVDAGRRRSFSGTCQPAVEPKLSFKVDGTIARRPVNMGDRVKRGTLIAELDPSDFQLQLEEAAAALRRAEAESRNAEASFTRIRGLYENGNASRTDFDEARAAAESSQANVESIRKRADLARQQLSYTRLVAPVAGAVAEVSAEVNENVRAGQEVVRLAAEEGYEVVVTVPESLIGEIDDDQDVRVTFDALPGRTFGGTVTEVGVTTSTMGTTFPVKARLVDEDPGVRPGMAAELEFRFASVGEAAHFRVPPHSVAEDRGGRFVFVVEPSDTGRAVVRRRQVEVGSLTPAGLEVLDGLQEGDHVVTAGISQLEDGDTVKLGAEGETVDLTRFALERRVVTGTLVVVLLFMGLLGFFALPRSEDPGFIIRVALVITYFPGASPERVEQLVTDRLEKAIQEIPELDFISSESKTGVSVIYVNILESYTEMRPIWDDLRRKVDEGQRPTSPRASSVPSSTTNSVTSSGSSWA